MDRKPGPQNGGQHEGRVEDTALGDAERRLGFDRFVGEGLADLVAEDLSDAFQVPAETHAVFLRRFVADLGQIGTQQGVGCAERDDFHSSSGLL